MNYKLPKNKAIGGLEMALTKLEQMEELQSLLSKDEPYLLFKHSLTCPISQAAFKRFNQYLEENKEINGYYLTVQESRPLSNYIEEHFSIKHESPQIFYIKNGHVKWHTSHEKITKDAIQREVNFD